MINDINQLKKSQIFSTTPEKTKKKTNLNNFITSINTLGSSTASS